VIDNSHTRPSTRPRWDKVAASLATRLVNMAPMGMALGHGSLAAQLEQGLVAGMGGMPGMQGIAGMTGMTGMAVVGAGGAMGLGALGLGRGARHHRCISAPSQTQSEALGLR